jgi:putative transposase
VLDALKAADVDDRIRSAATTIYQALIEAELTPVIGAGPHERTGTRTPAQRLPPAHPHHHGRGSGAAPPEAAARLVLSLPAGALAADRSALIAVVMDAYLHG